MIVLPYFNGDLFTFSFIKLQKNVKFTHFFLERLSVSPTSAYQKPYFGLQKTLKLLKKP